MQKPKIITIEDPLFGLGKSRYLKFLNSAAPICNLTAKVEITNLVKRKQNHKLNAMLVFCIQNVAQKIEGCHFEIVDEAHVQYFPLCCTNIVMYGKDGLLYYVSVPYCKDFKTYEKKYIENCDDAYNNCHHVYVPDQALTATSAIIQYEIESYSSGYTDDFMRPFLVWGKYSTIEDKNYLSISFRFHHGFFDGKDIATFYNLLQQEIDNFKD